MKSCQQIDESKSLKWKQREEIIRIKKTYPFKNRLHLGLALTIITTLVDIVLVDMKHLGNDRCGKVITSILRSLWARTL